MHFPVPPHAARGLIGAPLTAVHFPTDPEALHDWHCPVQTPSQQTPSTQLPEVHCVPTEQPLPLSKVFVQVPVESQ